MLSKKNMQDSLLNKLRQDSQSVTIFLVNGFQIRGHIQAFDNFIIVMCCEGKQQIIYKHAISTIIPSKNVQLSLGKTSELCIFEDEMEITSISSDIPPM